MTVANGANPLRPYTYYPLALLLLVCERPRHGYKLAEGLREQIGFEGRPASTVYKTLREMEEQEVIYPS